MDSYEQLVQFTQEQFRTLGRGMWPDGIAFQSEQHRDAVRLFVGGAFCFDRAQTPDLERLTFAISGEGWKPGREWNWAP